MRRKVLLSSLSVGRCFTRAIEPGGSTEESGSTEARRSDPILNPENAWKLTAETDGGFEAQNAQGETKAFAGDLEVVEIPRQGFDKLAERAASA